MISYLSIEHVMAIHDTLVEQFGGILGIRDKGLLDSAIRQPEQSFGGVDLYPSLFDKASAYAFSISENQPFLDGNKRTAASTANAFLDLNGYELDCPQGHVYNVMMALANKRLSRERLAAWFEKNSKKKSRSHKSKKRKKS